MGFKIALIQMQVAGGDKQSNLSRACESIAEAASEGAALVVLPETMDLGWTHPTSQLEAEPVPEGMPCQTLVEAAIGHGVYVCSGLTEAEGDRVFNSAVLIDPQGKLLLKHRKINELEIGQPFYARGDRLQVVDTELGRLGLMICADGFVEDCVISRSLGAMGAEVILSPCAWAVDADHDNRRDPYGDLWHEVYQPVAKEFGLWIVGVSNVGPIEAGPWTGRKCIGASLAIGPDGKEILQGPYGENAETILYLELGR